MGKVNLPASADQLLRDLLARVQALEAAAQTRVPMDTITGGALQVQDVAGNTYFYLGQISPNLPDGAPQYGLLVYRQSGDEAVGNLAMSMFCGTGALPQTFGLYDAAGNDVFTDDGLSAQGIGRPYMELGFQSSSSTVWNSTSSGSFQDMFFSNPPHQHPKVTAMGRVICPTGVNAALQLTAGGVALGSPTAVTGNTGVAQPFQIGPVAWAGSHIANVDLRLQARITSGAGTVQVGLANLYGQQS